MYTHIHVEILAREIPRVRPFFLDFAIRATLAIDIYYYCCFIIRSSSSSSSSSSNQNT